jgi:cysteine desulfurase
MAEWITRTAQFFATRSDAQLLIRVHPGERLTHGKSMVDVVREALPQLPENMRVIGPLEKVNTYDLMEVAALGLVYTTTTGMEMALRGLPVVACGETHYRQRGVTFHCDATQAVGKIPIDLRRSAIDMLSLSGHKLHAPKGIGALYIRRGTKFRPFLIGGHQERNRRGGTENVPGIVALGAAAELARRHLNEEQTAVRALRDRLEDGILERIPDVIVNGHRERRLPNTSNVSFEFVEGEAILLLLDQVGICASSGSACTSGSLEPSHVLRAMGVPFTYAHGSIRFSLSRYNTAEEIDRVLTELPRIIARLREISPFSRAHPVPDCAATCPAGCRGPKE